MFTSRWSHRTAALAGAGAVLFGIVSVGALAGVRSGKPILGYMPRSEQVYASWISEGKESGPRTWVPRWLALAGYPPFASLEGAEVSQKSAGWSGEKDTDEDLNHVIGAQLSRADLRYASASHAFLAGADLLGADLSGAVLRDADLRKADLGNAHLGLVNLFHANLRGAKLVNAKLLSTDFSLANLRGASLVNADMPKSKLFRTDLRGADLGLANLVNDDLSAANLGDADLLDANLMGANLSYANLVSAKNLKPEQIKQAAHWDKAVYDDATLKVLGLPPDHIQKLAQEYANNNQWPWVLHPDLPWLTPSAPNR